MAQPEIPLAHDESKRRRTGEPGLRAWGVKSRKRGAGGSDGRDMQIALDARSEFSGEDIAR